MNKYRSVLNLAMQASNEEEKKEAAQLFEILLKDLKDMSFCEFEEFADLAIFLSQDIWSELGMFEDVSSQLFAEYDLGAIEWIWRDSKFLATLPKFLKEDIHFGCFVLTEGRSNEEFTSLFAEVALKQECEICALMGDGWISPAVYVVEDEFVKVDLLENYYAHFRKQFDSIDDHKKYKAKEVLRALAGNSKTPERILKDLTHIHEKSLRHETRSINAGLNPSDATQDSYIDWKARATLARIQR
jgi:hypothetical protein